jgi:hypothetical protein
MARPRTIPDQDVFSAVRRLLFTGGEKAVTFGSVAQETRLAAPSLAQRYGSRDGMVVAALMAGWDALDAAAARAADSPQAYLKGLGDEAMPLLAAGARDAAPRDRAAAWGAAVEAGLARHFGSGAKGREAAAMMFAAWAGAQAWEAAGGRGFRLKDAAKRLG